MTWLETHCFAKSDTVSIFARHRKRGASMATGVIDGRLAGDVAGGTQARYDAIVVGSGHNGLIAAGYLARAGKRVLVLERRDIIGGATVSEEPWPGWKLSTCSYVCNLLMPEVIKDLDLVKYGYDVRPF